MKQKSAILQMFYGERGDANRMKYLPECDGYVDVVTESFDKLKDKLKTVPEVWELFLKYKDNLELLHLIEVDAHYCEGFKFGLLIGIEAGESKFEE